MNDLHKREPLILLVIEGICANFLTLRYYGYYQEKICNNDQEA